MLRNRSLRRIGGVGSIIVCVALTRDLYASPNYYSQGSATKIQQRVVVTSPKGGQFEAGASITIAWQKTTPDPKIQVWLYTATSDGFRADKVRYIAASVGASATWKAEGGQFDWQVPDNVPRGRYIVVVESGLDQAASAPFLIVDVAARLSPVRSGPAGVVKSASVESKGTKGSVKLASGDKTAEYQWGYGQCPSLVGGLPGALTTLAAIGNVSILPSIRDVVRKDKLEQTCLDGYTVNSPNPVAAAATTM